MRDLIKKFLDKKTAEIPAVMWNNSLSRTQIATCAILLEIAKSDEEFSEIEKDKIINILKRDFQLSDEDVRELIEAANKEIKENIDLWHFTNIINTNYSDEEKIRVMETVWRVIYADGKLDMNEDYLVHKLSNLLKLSHKQLIDAKIKVLYNK